MKYFLYLLLSFTACSTYAQPDPSLDSFRRNMFVQIKKPWRLEGDSCYYSITLLKMDIDKQSHVTSVLLADNAEQWFAADFLRMQKEKQINFSKIEEYAKKKGIKDASIIMPISAWASWNGSCKGRNDYWLDNRYFQFHGNALSGKCIFIDTWGYYPDIK